MPSMRRKTSNESGVSTQISHRGTGVEAFTNVSDQETQALDRA